MKTSGATVFLFISYLCRIPGLKFI